MKMLRMKNLELSGPSRNTFFRSFLVRGYYLRFNNRVYLTFAKKMADVCENVCNITKETNHYINERDFVIPADLLPNQHKPFWYPNRQIYKPIWWYGRVYEVDVVNPQVQFGYMK